MPQTAKNSQYTKTQNRLQLLRLLRQEPLSRATLARLTGLTRAAISLIVDELINEGMIQESAPAPATGTCGRIPILLDLCPDVHYAVGIYLSRHICRLGISDFSGRLLAEKSVVLSNQPSAQQMLESLAAEAEALIASCNIPRQRILGVGVASPGPVDAIGGRILNPPNFSLWCNCDICEILGNLMNLPVYLENDANAAALYNFTDNDFPEKENFLLLVVDKGVGSGVISEGTLLRSNGFTCELGHMSINYQGPECSCGNRGCLERYASIDGLLECFPDYNSLEALLSSPDADAALQKEAEYLSAAILNFTNVLRVEAVLISGDFRDHLDRLIPYIQKNLNGKSLSLGKNSLVIAPALHGESVRALAACGIVFSRYLDIC